MFRWMELSYSTFRWFSIYSLWKIDILMLSGDQIDDLKTSNICISVI